MHLFGSRATGKDSSLGDYDIGFEPYDQVRRLLKEDNIDIVILNLVEPRIFNEYFDFQSFLRRHNLTGVKL